MGKNKTVKTSKYFWVPLRFYFNDVLFKKFYLNWERCTIHIFKTLLFFILQNQRGMSTPLEVCQNIYYLKMFRMNFFSDSLTKLKQQSNSGL